MNSLLYSVFVFLIQFIHTKDAYCQDAETNKYDKPIRSGRVVLCGCCPIIHESPCYANKGYSDFDTQKPEAQPLEVHLHIKLFSYCNISVLLPLSRPSL